MFLLSPRYTKYSRAFSGLARAPGRLFSSGSKIETVDLAFDRYEPKTEPKGDPIVFLHGLFGSKVNNRTVSKVLSRDLSRTIYCLDLRNHGDSPHIDRHDYPALAADVENFIEQHQLGRSVLIGHSMGAKTAMGVALRRPELVSALVSVDNAPIDARLGSSFGKYVQGMKKVSHAKLKNTKEAYKIMADYEPDVPVQQFLLSNLRKNDKGEYEFRIPVEILAKSLDYLAEFPFDPKDGRYTGPTLFIRGTKSQYVADEAYPAIASYFPTFTMRDIEAGHWVISEAPQPFLEATKTFLNSLTED